MVGNEIEEGAKAIKATAETAGKAVDAAREIGGFLNRIFGGPLAQASAMLEDSLRFRREVRLLRLAQQYEKIRSELKITADPKPVEMKVGIPLINAAALEEDDKIQDMYARLLVNATDPNARIKAQRAFVTILEDVGPLEVLLLDRIYNAPKSGAVATVKLPDSYVESIDGNGLPSEEVQLALWNLARLGCIEPGGTWGGGSSVSVVTLTSLGRALVETCTTATSRAAPAEDRTVSWNARAHSVVDPGHL